MTQPHNKLGPIAADLLRHATIMELGSDAVELAALASELSVPLPELPMSALRAYHLLMIERQRARRLVELFRL